MRHIDLLIIGAGPTGLGAAYRAQERGLNWLAVEAANHAGGLGSSLHRDGYTWDLGGHVLHSHFPEFDKAIADVEMVPARRNGWALIGGELIATPVQRQLDELPSDVRPGEYGINLGAYYRNQFGRELAERFFIPFQEKMWATPVQLIDHSWTSLRSGSSEPNVPALALRADQPVDPAPVYFPYPAGGTGALWETLAASVEHRIVYNELVVSMDAATRTAMLSTGERIGYEQCVSTMALPQLAHLVGLPTFADLRANHVLLVGIGFRGTPPESLVDKSWVYCPDRTVAWHRMTMLSNYDPRNAPEGYWSVLFEAGYQPPFRTITKDMVFQSALDSLRQLGVRNAPDATISEQLSYGYPVPTLGRDTTLRLLDDRLRANGIYSRGRFGGWRYESCNSDYSFMQGWQAVDAYVDNSAEDVYWSPEKYS